MKNKSVITVGFFDGVHIGHRKLIELVINESNKSGYRSVLLTFDKPLGQKNQLLTLLEEKLELLNQFELSEIDVIRFDRKFANILPEEFFYEYLIKRYNMNRIIVGYDFVFGKNRAGDRILLESLCSRNNCEFISFNPVTVFDNSIVVSSSFIRSCINEGEIKLANDLLCRYYSIEGEIVRGKGVASHLGYPTVNLKVNKSKLLPNGVFRGYVTIEGFPYSAVINIGYRPTFFSDKILQCEVHIINFNTSTPLSAGLKKLKFFLIEKIRDERKFSGLQELKNQIEKDISFVKNTTANTQGIRVIPSERNEWMPAHRSPPVADVGG